ncbi:TonB-dependent receptor [Halarcobacter bivalviorum]|uniref:TonB-dependent receptor n=1 Tax=Halarcobacter bivalviorum TaxID=663364 RepID=A0AAX2AD79_9BACT|nr:TonB-dependent receptor [Halarcobacter bivalviorum]AXH12433.1 TonB-dependent siderophore receptor [Halarcobacter bivalviorum]RXK10641.1 TonB-dependent receptor [Halarcobacter bivalviorum]
MQKQKACLSVVASLFLATNLYSQTEQLSTIKVTSSYLNSNEKTATFSTEIYTKDEIEKSKSKDVYDFLNSQTSINIAPNYGNTFTQMIDLRGYGIGSGYQNVVVTVNGRKLNNVDMQSQLLSAIPISSIEKIEIIKGSGSVQYGDGANAGVINIITNGKNENYIMAHIGNDDTKGGTLSLGFNNQDLIINALVDYSSTNGTREDSLNNKDSNHNRNRKFEVIYFPTEKLELRAGRVLSDMRLKYAGPLTKDEYKDNPNHSSNLNEQYLNNYVTTLGSTYNFNDNYSLDINYSDEDKLSRFSSGWQSNYEYESFNASLNIKQNDYSVVVGVDSFDGDRISSADITNKTNKALFVSADYQVLNDLKVSAGLRREKVEYEYKPTAGDSLSNDEYLNAYDIGVNYSLSNSSSIFANYNRSYQAPDIDRFFKTDWMTGITSFNGLIKPMKVKNYTVGYTNIQKNNKLKISLFRSDLTNEIYLEPINYVNTNIDKSHKYGLEVFDKYLINENLYASINYSYIISKIDREDEGNGAYDGKDLPGVSKHNLTLNLGYTYKRLNTILSYTYRSNAYAANDFENNFDQKQEAYKSTDLSVSYNFNNIEVFAKVQNLFDEDNGLWISDDRIYPVNFERTYYAGIKYKF